MFAIKVLNDFEFNNLPFRHVKEAFGCANPKTGTAYVRRTGIKPLDTMVMDHEIDELVNKYSDHEDVDGIRYKKGKDVFKSVAPILGGIVTGGLLAPALGIGATMSNVIGGVTGAGIAGGQRGGKPKEWLPSAAMGGLSGVGGASLGRGAVSGFKAAEPGFLSKAGGTMKGAAQGLGFGGSAKAAAPAATAAPAGTAGSIPSGWTPMGYTPAGAPGYGFPASRGLSITGAPSTAGSAAQGAWAASLPSEAASTLGFQGLRDPFKPKLPLKEAVEAPTVSTAPAAAAGKENLFKKALTSGGVSGIGQMMAPPVEPFEPFESSPLVQEVLERTNAFEPFESDLFQEVLARTRAGTQQSLTEDQKAMIVNNLDEQLQGVRDELKQRFKALRPGSDIENDSSYREAIMELESDFAERKSRVLSEFQLTTGRQTTQDLKSLALTEAGYTQDQISTLAQLAQLDVQSLAYKTGLSAQEAQEFKEMFAQLGVAAAGF